ncbi:hypothetical protein AGOR_G00201640 [Albula goreensis]|uniref:Uncharacterized protein n=1 Tax=Albula goreensis TaxID=1534307 RepID=A0A8T3CTB7_9TELE|nr:hypothetical protein AGOR_G00201640 [Albula goreensis]
MSGNISASAVLGFNRTVLETAERDMNDAIHEFKIFNITITSLALCILTFTGVFCSLSYHNKRRQRKQARAYETRVGRDGSENPPVDVCEMQRTHSLRNPFSLLRRQEAPKNRSGIYFIYSNPVAEEEASDAPLQEAQAGPPPPLLPANQQEQSSDHTHSGIILDPSTFYMQL